MKQWFQMALIMNQLFKEREMTDKYDDAKVMHDTQDKTAALIGYIMVALVSGGLGVLFGLAV